jgi:bifunctional diaminopimelate decarboxylase / aspartate kinase
VNLSPASLPDDAPWVVIKFGGTSVSTRPRWDNIARIAGAHRAAGRRVLIVVSALSGITDMLKRIGEAFADPGLCGEIRGAIAERHHALLGEMELPRRNGIDAWMSRLDQLLADPRCAAGELSWQADVLALGELSSSTLGALYLNACGLTTHWIDSRDYFRAEALPNQAAWGRWLSASVRVRHEPAIAAALAARGDVFIAQGFIARSGDGETAVLGRGGSDTSAAYYGALLKAEAVEIWTDVPGMFSANPRQVPDARLLARLDYAEAQEIATTGAKVLHPRCIHPVRDERVPIRIKDTNRPDLPGTEIVWNTQASAPSVKAISSRKGITLVSMESISMWQQVGFLADVFEAFKRHGLSVDLIGSAETNVTVSLDPSDNLLNSDVLARLCADLEAFCRVKVIAPCAAITLVGRGMRAMLHKLSAVLAEFGALDVHLISQSSNNLNLTFVIDEALVDSLIPRLHALLIRAEVMRVDDQTVFGPSWRELAAESALIHRPVWWRKQRSRLLEIAAKSSPAYVYSLDQVREQARGLTALGIVDRWQYALKANPHPEILRSLHAEGFAFECVSWNEVEAVRATLPELPAERILFTPNFAPREEYRAALSAGVRVTLDALHPIAEWGEDFAGRDIFLRVDLGAGRGHHDKVKTGGAQSKFGVSLDEIESFRSHARRHGARIVGLHAHLGSGILDAQHWRSVYVQLASLAEQFNRIEVLDLGGGLGVPSRPEDLPLDIEALGAALAEVKQAYPQFQLWMEPGRYMVAEAGVLLARVTQTKRKGDVHYVGVDAGMNSLIRPALYEAWHEIVNLSRLDEPTEELVQVVGPICETGDVLGNNRRLPSCHEGDVILIAEAGAYGAVMASHYNLREPASEVCL